mgnify:CR=1 FL=1
MYEGEEENVEIWCSDRLHDVLGHSDRSLALYLTHVAKKANSYESVLSVLREGGGTTSNEEAPVNLFCARTVCTRQ